MGEIKTQRDARGLTVLVTRPRTFGDVTSRAIPIRTTQNIRKCVITRSMREIRRIGREPKEKLIADAMRVQETQRLDRANQFYNALHRTSSLLRQVNQREEEIKSRVAELGAVNERLRATNQELEATNEELRVTTAQLEAANAELESFSYSVSHDLRAPLRAIDGFSKVLLEDYSTKLDEEGQRYLDIIRDNSQKMGRLIDDLLALSRLGRQPLNKATVDMPALVTEVFTELKEPERDVQFSLGTLPPAYGDHSLLRQVLANLLGNALKFTRQQRTAIIEVGGRGDNQETTYYVKDNGVGFDMRYSGKLFHVFQRLHADTEFEGTGVGLAIVQCIVHRHGGRVWAEGKVNQGATFYWALPLNGG